MPFYTPRNIGPSDQILFDANGDPVGIQPGGSAQPPLMGLTPGERTSVQALVSEAGNITAADLATTTGTLGQTVRLSDGDNKGAILMWSTPAGATTPTWCWWLWPQAAY